MNFSGDLAFISSAHKGSTYQVSFKYSLRVVINLVSELRQIALDFPRLSGDEEIQVPVVSRTTLTVAPAGIAIRRDLPSYVEFVQVVSRVEAIIRIVVHRECLHGNERIETPAPFLPRRSNNERTNLK